jgi:hypothetical protein
MEFLRANWVWILFGLGIVGLFFRRGGMGCGMGERGGHTPAQSSEGPERETAGSTPRRHRGCC